ncbi:hypothetical protein ElyMa_002842800 [Elysia marginata]|uniref:PNPLA domain-containing protein n=1 Tax=Elysia marginata TaxID=1093978 RepID=A0AAV4HW76_9GAST|nr:hypothetical protein ElyMa_002842800 [Elysia marginata]
MKDVTATLNKEGRFGFFEFCQSKSSREESGLIALAVTAKICVSASYFEHLALLASKTRELPSSCDFPTHDAIWTLSRGTHHGVRPDRHVDGGLYNKNNLANLALWPTYTHGGQSADSMLEPIMIMPERKDAHRFAKSIEKPVDYVSQVNLIDSVMWLPSRSSNYREAHRMMRSRSDFE